MSVPDPAAPAVRITPEMLLSRRVDFERRMRRAPPVTVALVGVLALVFAWEVARDLLDSRAALIAAGALARDLVLTGGQYWRMVSAIFLHGGAGHLLGNAIALYILGMICEHAFGPRQLVILYVVSGLAGSAGSMLWGPGPSVGASGAIFGLQGAAIVLFRQHRDRLLLRDRRIGGVLLVWAIFTILSGLTSPYIDNGAHIGGALGGAVVARRLHPVVLGPMPPDQARRVARGLAGVGAILAASLVAWLAR
jgi:rhomboid protease GluP